MSAWFKETSFRSKVSSGSVFILAALAISSLDVDRAGAQWTERAYVEHAAYRIAKVPSALVHAPASFDGSRRFNLVVFLHGYLGCAEVLMSGGLVSCTPDGIKREGWDLGRAHDKAGINSIFVVPQLAYLKRSADPGNFSRASYFRTFLEELLRGVVAKRLGRITTLDDVASITLVAHSAGYKTAIAILRDRQAIGLIRYVILLDALYAGVDEFMTWVDRTYNQNTRLVSLYTGHRSTSRHNERLVRIARGKLGAHEAQLVEISKLTQAVRSSHVAVSRVDVAHRQIPEAFLDHTIKAVFGL